VTASLLICGDCGGKIEPATNSSLPRCPKCYGKQSRYHVLKQHDGRGFGIVRQDAADSPEAVVLHADLSRDEADTLCRSYRAEEIQINRAEVR
jgi:hypothetical protein